MPQTTSQIARACQILTIAVWGASPFVAGCMQPCAVGETRCAGDDVLSTCTATSDSDFATTTWHDTKCTVACREAGGDASCVSARDPVPECVDGAEICYQNTPSSCRGGYPVRHTPCSGDTRCVVSPTCGPMCALDDAPDARCAASPFCDGDGNMNTCSCDFVVARGSCGGADRCQTLNGISRCAP